VDILERVGIEQNQVRNFSSPKDRYNIVDTIVEFENSINAAVMRLRLDLVMKCDRLLLC